MPGPAETDLDPTLAQPSTRRAMLSRSGVGLAVAGLTLTGCGSHAATPDVVPSPQRAHADVVVLNRLLDLEHEAAAAYTAGIPLIDGQIAREAKQILSDELAHAGELYLLIKRQGGVPVKPRTSYPLGNPGTRAAVLSLWHTIERRQIAAYLQAISVVAPGGARSALAAILGSDAQHVALIRGALGVSPLAGPFVTGAA